ncbi:zinc finger, PMZ-type containing protein [Tanacetum coccineum]
MHGACHSIKRLYYCKTSTTLALGIKELKLDTYVEDMLNVGYDNGNMIDLFIEYYDYDVMGFINIKPSLEQNIEDSDCYSSDDGKGMDDVEFQTKGDDNVVIKDISTSYPFLNNLCSSRALFRGSRQQQVPDIDDIEEDPDNDQIDPLHKVKKEGRCACKKGNKVMPNKDKSGVGNNANLGNGEGSSKQVKKSNFKRLDVFESDGSPYFKRMYICFKGVKDGWLAGCRKVIGLDGCFLKHTCRGELLTAMGRDVKNQMYPIAWVVVRVENAENWSWFLALLQEDLALNDGTDITIISDSHKYRAFFEMDRRCAAFENVCINPLHRHWIVYPSGFQELEVRNGDESYGVNLQHKVCSCRMWELSGVLCVHVVAGYMHLNHDLDIGVSFWYSQEAWYNAYRFSIKPVTGSRYWKRTSVVPSLPPLIRKMPGSRGGGRGGSGGRGSGTSGGTSVRGGNTSRCGGNNGRGGGNSSRGGGKNARGGGNSSRGRGNNRRMGLSSGAGIPNLGELWSDGHLTTEHVSLDEETFRETMEEQDKLEEEYLNRHMQEEE